MASCMQSVSTSCPLSLQIIARLQPLLTTSTLEPKVKPLLSLTGIDQILHYLSASTLSSAPSVYSQHTSWSDILLKPMLQQEWNAWDYCSNTGVGIRRPDIQFFIFQSIFQPYDCGQVTELLLTSFLHLQHQGFRPNALRISHRSLIVHDSDFKMKGKMASHQCTSNY